MEQSEKDEVLKYVKDRIGANRERMRDAASFGEHEYYDGANTALEELAVFLELVEGYGKL